MRALIQSQANGSIPDAVRANLLSRADYLLLHRARHDIVRLPLFALIVLIFGEWTPLLLFFGTGLIPLTCRIPKQILTDRRKLEKRRKVSFRGLTVPPPAAAPEPLVPPPSSTMSSDATTTSGNARQRDMEERPGIDHLHPEQIRHISRSLNLHSRYWPELPLLPPNALLRVRIRKRVEYLRLDDALLARDGGVAQLEMDEVRMALVERGLDVLARSDEQLRAALEHWLRARPRDGVWRVLLTR